MFITLDNLRLGISGAWNNGPRNVRQMGKSVCQLGAETEVQFAGSLKGRVLHIKSEG